MTTHDGGGTLLHTVAPRRATRVAGVRLHGRLAIRAVGATVHAWH